MPSDDYKLVRMLARSSHQHQLAQDNATTNSPLGAPISVEPALIRRGIVARVCFVEQVASLPSPRSIQRNRQTKLKSTPPKPFETTEASNDIGRVPSVHPTCYRPSSSLILARAFFLPSPILSSSSVFLAVSASDIAFRTSNSSFLRFSQSCESARMKIAVMCSALDDIVVA